jgi:putative transposase
MVSGMAKNHSLAGTVLDCGFHEIRRQFQYKSAMRSGRIVVANRFFPSRQVCSSCNATAGRKGRGELNVEEWTCRECGVVNGRDSHAAINLRKSGAVGAEVTRGDITDTRQRVGKCRGEPRTKTMRTCAPI